MAESRAEYPRASKEAAAKRFSILNVVVLLGAVFVVMAVMWPTTTGSKFLAKRAKCLTNLKQLSLSAILYSSDNNDQLPFGRGLVTPSSDPNLPVYETLLAPYIKSDHAFSCTDDVEAKRSTVQGKSWFEVYGSSYKFRPILAQLKPFGSCDGADKIIFIHEAANFHKASETPSRNAAFYDGHAKFVTDDKVFGNAK